MDYGSHTPFILAAYGVSFVALGVLIWLRARGFARAQAAEKRLEKKADQA